MVKKLREEALQTDKIRRIFPGISYDLNSQVIRIQRMYRGRKARRMFYLRKMKQLAIDYEKQQGIRRRSRPRNAAITIQNAWRTYVQRPRSTKILQRWETEQKQMATRGTLKCSVLLPEKGRKATVLELKREAIVKHVSVIVKALRRRVTVKRECEMRARSLERRLDVDDRPEEVPDEGAIAAKKKSEEDLRRIVEAMSDEKVQDILEDLRDVVVKTKAAAGTFAVEMAKDKKHEAALKSYEKSEQQVQAAKERIETVENMLLEMQNELDQLTSEDTIQIGARLDGLRSTVVDYKRQVLDAQTKCSKAVEKQLTDKDANNVVQRYVFLVHLAKLVMPRSANSLLFRKKTITSQNVIPMKVACQRVDLRVKTGILSRRWELCCPTTTTLQLQ